MVTVEVPASGAVGERVNEREVKRRLRTLLDLAIQIGRREGLLGRETAAKEEPDGIKEAP